MALKIVENSSKNTKNKNGIFIENTIETKLIYQT